MTARQELNQLLGSGWKIVSDGPSGVQLEGPKKMRTLDQLCFAGGVVLCFLIAPLGILLVLVAIVDYAAFTKPPRQFIPATALSAEIEPPESH